MKPTLRNIKGMSYEQASREGDRLIKEAAASGSWHHIVDHLAELRNLMLLLRKGS